MYCRLKWVDYRFQLQLHDICVVQFIFKSASRAEPNERVTKFGLS